MTILHPSETAFFRLAARTHLPAEFLSSAVSEPSAEPIVPEMFRQ